MPNARSIRFAAIGCLIALGIFLAIGYSSDPAAAAANTDLLKQAIDAQFNITPWLFLVPAAVLGISTTVLKLSCVSMDNVSIVP